MSDTPETDAEAMDIGMGHFMVDAIFARRLERERDEARNKLADALQEVDLRTLDYERIKEQNAKLRDIAKRAIEAFPFTEGYGEFSYAAAGLRAELDQLKEGAK